MTGHRDLSRNQPIRIDIAAPPSLNLAHGEIRVPAKQPDLHCHAGGGRMGSYQKICRTGHGCFHRDGYLSDGQRKIGAHSAQSIFPAARLRIGVAQRKIPFATSAMFYRNFARGIWNGKRIRTGYKLYHLKLTRTTNPLSLSGVVSVTPALCMLAISLTMDNPNPLPLPCAWLPRKKRCSTFCRSVSIIPGPSSSTSSIAV